MIVCKQCHKECESNPNDDLLCNACRADKRCTHGYLVDHCPDCMDNKCAVALGKVVKLTDKLAELNACHKKLKENYQALKDDEANLVSSIRSTLPKFSELHIVEAVRELKNLWLQAERQVEALRQAKGKLEGEKEMLLRTQQRGAPHLIVCNYHTKAIGEDGCICKVVNKNELIISRSFIANLLSEIMPKDAVAWRSTDGASLTTLELIHEVETGTELGQAYTTDLLRISRDLLTRSAKRTKEECLKEPVLAPEERLELKALREIAMEYTSLYCELAPKYPNSVHPGTSAASFFRELIKNFEDSRLTPLCELAQLRAEVAKLQHDKEEQDKLISEWMDDLARLGCERDGWKRRAEVAEAKIGAPQFVGNVPPKLEVPIVGAEVQWASASAVVKRLVKEYNNAIDLDAKRMCGPAAANVACTLADVLSALLPVS